MQIQHNNGVPEINYLFLDIVEVHGVAKIDNVIVTSNGQPFTAFTFDYQEPSQVCQTLIDFNLLFELRVSLKSSTNVHILYLIQLFRLCLSKETIKETRSLSLELLSLGAPQIKFICLYVYLITGTYTHCVCFTTSTLELCAHL